MAYLQILDIYIYLCAFNVSSVVNYNSNVDFKICPASDYTIPFVTMC